MQPRARRARGSPAARPLSRFDHEVELAFAFLKIANLQVAPIQAVACIARIAGKIQLRGQHPLAGRLHFHVDVPCAARIFRRHDGLEAEASLRIRELVTPVAKTLIVVIAQSVGMPEIEQRIRHQLALRRKDQPANHQHVPVALLQESVSLRRVGLEERPFGLACRERAASQLRKCAPCKGQRQGGAQQAAALGQDHAEVLSVLTSSAYETKDIAAQAATTTAIGTAPCAWIQPTAALATTPVSAWLAPSSDDAPPARLPKGARATAEALEAISPRLAMARKSAPNTPANPAMPVSAQARSNSAAMPSRYTPQPSTRRGPRPASSLRLSCDTVMNPSAFAPKYQPNRSAGTLQNRMKTNGAAAR